MKKIINSLRADSQIVNSNNQKTLIVSGNLFQNSKSKKEKNVNNSNEITIEEFSGQDIWKKSKKNDKVDRNAKIDMILNSGKNSVEKKIKQEPHVINLGIKEEKPLFDISVYPRKSNQSTIRLEGISIEESRRKTELENGLKKNIKKRNNSRKEKSSYHDAESLYDINIQLKTEINKLKK